MEKDCGTITEALNEIALVMSYVIKRRVLRLCESSRSSVPISGYSRLCYLSNLLLPTFIKAVFAVQPSRSWTTTGTSGERNGLIAQ